MCQSGVTGATVEEKVKLPKILPQKDIPKRIASAIAFGSICIMALLPVYFGAIRSVEVQKPDPVSEKIGVVLVLQCLLLNNFPRKYINFMFTLYIMTFGIFDLASLISPVITKLVPAGIPNAHNRMEYYKFNHIDFTLSSIVGIWYLWKKHWIANNLFVMAMVGNDVEFRHFDYVVSGCILLSLWVFVNTASKSVEAPIKLIFPSELKKKFSGERFVMLGLGDILFPGCFMALMLRFDNHLDRDSKTYFNTSFLAYIIGLFTVFFVGSKNRRGQPAVLYLVLACVGAPLLVAFIKVDIEAMFEYEDSRDDHYYHE